MERWRGFHGYSTVGPCVSVLECMELVGMKDLFCRWLLELPLDLFSIALAIFVCF